MPEQSLAPKRTVFSASTLKTSTKRNATKKREKAALRKSPSPALWTFLTSVVNLIIVLLKHFWK